MSTDNIIEFPSDAELDEFSPAEQGEQFEMPSFHPILKIWLEVLKPAKGLRDSEPLTPQYASKMVQTYAELKYADIPELHNRYYDKLETLLDLLKAEVEGDDQCLLWGTPQEDAVENAVHYKNIIVVWHQQFLAWELEWHPTDADAAVELAANGEVHQMFFGPVGLLPQLSRIGFEFTEDDQEMLVEALAEFRESYTREEK